MVRQILAGIVGYIAMFIFVFATFSIAYLGMGTDVAFEPGTYDVTMTWIIASTILGFIAAVGGGYVAAIVGKSGLAPKITASIVLVMGIVVFAMTVAAPATDEVRPAGVPNMEAMSKARTPTWVAALNPIIVIVGVLIGGRLHRKETL